VTPHDAPGRTAAGFALPLGAALPAGALMLVAGWLVGVAADDSVPDAPGWLAALAAVAFVALAGWVHRRWNPDARETRDFRRLARVALNTDHPVVICDTARRIVWANTAFETLTGYSVDEAVGHSPGALMQCEDTDPATVARIRAALDAGQGVRVEILNRTKQGARVWVELDIQPIRDARGTLEGFIAVKTDLTQRRRVEDALGAERERLQAIIDGTRAGTWEWDADGGTVVCDELWARIAGVSPDAQRHLAWSDWVARLHPQDGERVEQRMRAHLAGESDHFDCEVRIARDDGRWTWARARGRLASRRDDDGSRRVYGTLIDISERKRADESLERAHAKLRSLFEHAPVGISLNEMASGRFVECNDAMLAIVGYTRAELEQATYWQVTPREYEAQEAQQLASLRESGRYGPYEKEYLRRDGSRVPVLLNGVRVIQPDGAEYIWSIVQDISARKQIERQLHAAARLDKLTGLANRELLVERLDLAVERALADPAQGFSVLFLDFDRFKQVNDALGHDAGDDLLRQIADRMRATLRASDLSNSSPDGNVVARFGGDEFVVLLNGGHDIAVARRVAERLLSALTPPYRVAGHEIQSSASIGIVTSEQCRGASDLVLRNADTAMYEAKRAGRGRAMVYDDEMHTRVSRQMAVEQALRQALDSDQLSLVYQPTVDLASGRRWSVEALLRWEHPALGAVSPAEFVPIAEETGLIVPISEWVIRESCRQLADWRRASPALAPARVSVNVARMQLMQPDRLLESVQRSLRDAGVEPAALMVEIGERDVVRNAAASHALLKSLRALGVGLAMDDYGSGASAFGGLRDFAFDVIKLDRQFVHDFCASPDGMAVLHSTVTLIENLGMASVAKGVETPAQRGFLQAIGCRYGQGFLLGRPVPAAEVAPCGTPAAQPAN